MGVCGAKLPNAPENVIFWLNNQNDFAYLPEVLSRQSDHLGSEVLNACLHTNRLLMYYEILFVSIF